MTQGFPELWVRAHCVSLYGGPIANNTWSKYKKICQVNDFRKSAFKDRLISKTHAQWLFMLAWIRHEQRRGDGTKPPAGRGSGVSLEQIILRLNSNPALKQKLDESMGDSIILNGVLGRDVPDWISMQIGKKPSPRTIRRWSKEHNIPFGLNQKVPLEALDIFLKIA